MKNFFYDHWQAKLNQVAIRGQSPFQRDRYKIHILIPLQSKNASILLIVIFLGLLSASACTSTCSEGLTPAQCANEGTHEYVRTYEFVEGCGESPGLIEGISEFTWTFSPNGDTITFAPLFGDSPVPPEKLTRIEPDVYRPEFDTSLPNQIHLAETGFSWLFFDSDSNDLCYQVTYMLPEK